MDGGWSTCSSRQRYGLTLWNLLGGINPLLNVKRKTIVELKRKEWPTEESE